MNSNILEINPPNENPIHIPNVPPIEPINPIVSNKQWSFQVM